MSSWGKLLEDSDIKPKLKDWLTDLKSITFKIHRENFHKLGLKPGKMIPQYTKERLPQILKTLELELFRTGTGECVLTKTGEGRKINSLFPKLPQNLDKYIGTSFQPIRPDSILVNPEFVNEETGVFLAVRTGTFSAFLVEKIGGNHVFSHSGRLNTNIEGDIYIASEKVHIDSTQMECDAILESDEVMIAVEAKKGFQSSFSIHQLVFPMMLLRRLYPEKHVYGLYFQFDTKPTLTFQLHLLNIRLRNDYFDITNYEFIASKAFQIHFKLGSILTDFFRTVKV